MNILKCTLLASAMLTVSTESIARDCSDIRGEWVTNINARVVFDAVDSKTGQLTGTYYSFSPPHKPFPLTGYVIQQPKVKEGQHNAVPLSFVVSFPDDGEMVSWTGICRMLEGKPVLDTEDHIVSASARNRWVHVSSNHDTIIPK